MNLPTAKEINPYDDLDGKWTENHFLGKTVDEVTELFRQNILTYQEDLMWMGPRAFEYYLPAVFNYISTPFAKDISNFIPYLKIALAFQLDKYEEEIKSTFDTINNIINYILNNIDQFDLDEYDIKRWENELKGEFLHIQERINKFN